MTEPNPADVLAPCPFCGGEAAHGHSTYSRPLPDTWWADGSLITQSFFVNCVECGATSRSGLVWGYQTKAEAETRWNNRQPTQSDADIIANERKAIAAWLRGEVDTDYTDPEYDIGRNLADAVERGAYIQEQSK